MAVFAALASGIWAQADRSTRPRVAATPAPPVLQNDTYRPADNGRPPVLGGNTTRPVPAPTATPAANDDEVITVETNLVTMPVSVLDRDGRFISGLQQRDFQIFENGAEQKVEYFQSVEQPFTVVLLIDVSPSTQFRIDEIQQAAMTFVDKLRPADRVLVMSFDEHIHVLSRVTNDRFELKDAIRQAQFGDGTSLYDAVDNVIYRQLSQIQGRKAVVLFTDGVDTTSRRSNLKASAAATEEVDALFYTIRYDTSRDGNFGGARTGGGNPPRGGGRVTMADILGAILTGGNVSIGSGAPGGATAQDYAQGKQYLETLATNSGGRSFEAQSMYNIDAAFSGIAEELRRQYTLGYYPETVGKLGERRQIKIRVARPNVVVRAKNSYIVGQTDRSIAGK